MKDNKITWIAFFICLILAVAMGIIRGISTYNTTTINVLFVLAILVGIITLVYSFYTRKKVK